MTRIKIQYGPDSIERGFETPITVGQLKQNATVRAALGYGDNVNVLINGVAQGDNTVIPNDSVVTIETAANSKASN